MLLNVEYLDIYFIHWPGKQKLKREDPLNKEFRKQSYLAIEKLYRDKKIKYIGVSNYTIRHLEEIKEFANLPHILQVEFHPLIYSIQKPLLDYCNQNNIIFQAYSSFGEGVLLSGQHPSYQLLSNIGMKYNVKISQVLLRWAIQHGAHVIPKSTNIERQKENFDISHFELELEDMLLIDRLDQTESKRFCWDPTDVY